MGLMPVPRLLRDAIVAHAKLMPGTATVDFVATATMRDGEQKSAAVRHGMMEAAYTMARLDMPITNVPPLLLNHVTKSISAIDHAVRPDFSVWDLCRSLMAAPTDVVLTEAADYGMVCAVSGVLIDSLHTAPHERERLKAANDRLIDAMRERLHLSAAFVEAAGELGFANGDDLETVAKAIISQGIAGEDSVRMAQDVLRRFSHQG